MRVPLPIEVVPSTKLTVPDGVPEPVEVTVAVNVTDCPAVDGFAEEVSAVVVGVETVRLNASREPAIYAEAYTFLPSGVALTEIAPSRAVPIAQLPAVPSELTHPSVPLNCVNTPVVALRENTAMALPTWEAA